MEVPQQEVPLHNIVIAGAGLTKRSQAVRSIEELLARTPDPLVTIPLHTPKDDDIPEVMAWAYGTAKRLGVKFNVIMIEEDYETATERHVVGGEYDFVNRLIEDAHEVAVVSEDGQVFSVAVQEADEVVLAWADEDPISAKVLRLAQKRHLPVTDLTQSIDTSAGETDEDDEAIEAADEAEARRTGGTFAKKYLGSLEDDASPWDEPSDPLREAIDALVDAVVAEVVKGVTAALKASQ